MLVYLEQQKFEKHALVHQDVQKKMFLLRLGLDSLDCKNYFSLERKMFVILYIDISIRWHKYVVTFFKTINFNIITHIVKQVSCHLVSICFHVFGLKVRYMCRIFHSIYK